MEIILLFINLLFNISFIFVLKNLVLTNKISIGDVFVIYGFMNIMESFSDELNMILYGNIEVKNAVNRIKNILKTREDSINNTTNRDKFF